MKKFALTILVAIAIAMTATMAYAKEINESNAAIAYSAMTKYGVTISLSEKWNPYYFYEFGPSSKGCEGTYFYSKNDTGSTKVIIGAISQCRKNTAQDWGRLKENIFDKVYGQPRYDDEEKRKTSTMMLGSGQSVDVEYKLFIINGHHRNAWFAPLYREDGLAFLVSVFNHNANESIPEDLVREILGSIHLLGVDEIPKKVVAEPPS